MCFFSFSPTWSPNLILNILLLDTYISSVIIVKTLFFSFFCTLLSMILWKKILIFVTLIFLYIYIFKIVYLMCVSMLHHTSNHHCWIIPILINYLTITLYTYSKFIYNLQTTGTRWNKKKLTYSFYSHISTQYKYLIKMKLKIYIQTTCTSLWWYL